MPDVLLTEAGDRLVQQDGSALVLELRPRGALSEPRLYAGAPVSPIIQRARTPTLLRGTDP